MGAMPYILETCIVLAAIINDWASMGIILCMLICNGCLGFHEELKAAASLVRSSQCYPNLCIYPIASQLHDQLHDPSTC
jgi:magnesium-transporting ATPase (P-type)